MSASKAEFALSWKLWLERGQWPYCEMGAFVDDQSSGNQGNEGVYKMQLQTAMQQMQVQRCTTQLHSPLLLLLWKEGFLQLSCCVVLCCFCCLWVATLRNSLDVPNLMNLRLFSAAPNFVLYALGVDFLWYSFFISCVNILIFLSCFHVSGLLKFWCSLIDVFVFLIFVQ